MKTITPLAKKTLVAMTDEQLAEFGWKKAHCCNYHSRKEAEDNIYRAYFISEKQKETRFFDINENPDYYEIFEDEEIFNGYGEDMLVMSGRRYIICENCGFISFDDLVKKPREDGSMYYPSCKCGGFYNWSEISHDEYDKMVADKKASDDYGRLVMDDYYKEDDAKFVAKLVKQMNGEKFN